MAKRKKTARELLATANTYWLLAIATAGKKPEISEEYYLLAGKALTEYKKRFGEPHDRLPVV